MQEFQNIYLDFIQNVPENIRPLVSIGLALLIVYSVFQIIKKNFVYIIVLIILLPASVPMLKNVWQGVLFAIKFLLNTK